jgi:small redox-active disulfide protein 2
MTTIQILGTGCKKCVQLAENAKQAVEEAGVDAQVEKIEDINRIVEFGVMMTPALAIDGQVKLVGKVASPEEIKKLLQP